MATRTETVINAHKDEIINVVSTKLKTSFPGSTTHDLAISWKGMQDVAAKEIRKLLNSHLPDSIITSPES